MSSRQIIFPKVWLNRWIGLVLLGSMGLPSISRASELRVIVHASNVQTLSQHQVYDIYYGDLTHWITKSRILPALLSGTSAITEDIIRELMDLPLDEFSGHWRRRLFSGMGIPPRELDSIQQLISFVAQTGNAIGLVPTDPSQSSDPVIVSELKNIRILRYSDLTKRN